MKKNISRIASVLLMISSISALADLKTCCSVELYDDDKMHSFFDAQRIDNIWVSLVGVGPPSSSLPTGLKLVEFSLSGNIVKSTNMPIKFEGLKNSNIKSIQSRAMVITPKGDIITYIKVYPGGNYYVRVSRDGKIKKIISAESFYRTLDLSKLSIAPDGNILALGRIGKSSIIIKLDDNFNILWQRRLAFEESSRIIDIAFLDDSELLLVRNSGVPTKFGYSESKVILSRHDKNGKTLKKLIFPGRGGRIEKIESKAVIVYNADQTIGQNITVKAFETRKLKEIWKTELLQQKMALWSPELAINGNNIFVTDRKGPMLWVAKINHKGVMVDQYIQKTREFPYSFKPKMSEESLLIFTNNNRLAKSRDMISYIKVIVIKR
jgi:WD40 repeat protein